jgi:hypothetical protein
MPFPDAVLINADHDDATPLEPVQFFVAQVIIDSAHRLIADVNMTLFQLLDDIGVGHPFRQSIDVAVKAFGPTSTQLEAVVSLRKRVLPPVAQALGIDAQVSSFAHPKENAFVPDGLIPNIVKTGIMHSAAEMPAAGAPFCDDNPFNPDDYQLLVFDYLQNSKLGQSQCDRDTVFAHPQVSPSASLTEV